MKSNPVWLAILAVACAFAQPAPVGVSFDAASVKPSGPDTKGSGARFLPGGRFEARNSSLMAIFVLAYDVTEFQVEGAPAWVK